MKLTWIHGVGPGTTQELADLVEQEGFLIKGEDVNRRGRRCLWGVIEDAHFDRVALETFIKRFLSSTDIDTLGTYGLSASDNDDFPGNGRARCAEMVKRLRAIP